MTVDRRAACFQARASQIRRNLVRCLIWSIAGWATLAISAGCYGAPEESASPIEECVETPASSWIERIAFVREGTSDVGRLTVRIQGEDIHYLDVPVSLWEQFKMAESPGAFYGKHIKNRFERSKGVPLGERFEAVAGTVATGLVECAFNEDCEPLLLRTIESATNKVRVAAYAFTRTRIAAALANAHERGVDVRVKIDAKQAEYPSAQRVIQFLRDRGIPVTLILVQGDYSAMHNKFVVVDERCVAAGSYNFTTTAGSANWENLLLVNSEDIAVQYEKAWNAIVSE